MSFKSVVKGYLGEKVNGLLLQQLPANEYRIINNVIIRLADGSTTQIDHVVVSVYGIFVIETKNYKGKIYGTEYAGQWTQYMGQNSYSFMNPLHQNYKHVAVLKQLTGLEDNCFIPIVAFSGEASLKVQTKEHVVSFGQLVSVIRSYQIPRLSADMVGYYEEWIRSANNTGVWNQIQHICKVNSTIAQKERKISSGLCPRCGGKLVQRNGKRGSFLGCSNYPKCRYTKNVGIVAEAQLQKAAMSENSSTTVRSNTNYLGQESKEDKIEQELLQLKRELGML